MGRRSRGEAVFLVFDYALMVVFAIVIVVPLWTVVMTSFVGHAEIARRGAFIMIPQEWDFTSYRLLLGSRSNIGNAYRNTVFVVVMGTLINMVLTVMMAYGLSKKDLKGRNFVTGMVLATMLFSGGMIPSYLLVKSLGLLDSLWALILPGAISSWNMFIMRNFFYAIPDSLEEAAYLDGANPVQVLVSVVLPLSLPAIATIGLFYAVGHWKSWFSAMLYITDNRKLPVQNILRNIVATSSTASLHDVDSSVYEMIDAPPPAQSLKSAAIIVSTVPILFIYPFIQKYFVKGILVGSIKG